MAALSKKLRSADGATGLHIAYWCPGCEEVHMVDAAWWHWDGNVDAPTLSPSVRHFIPQHSDEDGTVYQEETTCHYFLQQGRFNFCGDCQHELSGQQGIELPDWPYVEGEYGGV